MSQCRDFPELIVAVKMILCLSCSQIMHNITMHGNFPTPDIISIITILHQNRLKKWSIFDTLSYVLYNPVPPIWMLRIYRFTIHSTQQTLFIKMLFRIKFPFIWAHFGSLWDNFVNLSPVTQVFWMPSWIYANDESCPKFPFGQPS